MPDTSIWIQSLRGVAAVEHRLRPLIEQRAAVVCEPIAMEVLSGASDAQIDAMEAMLDSLPGVAVDPNVDFRVAADLARRVRSSGNTLRSPFDALIAAVALRHPDVVLIHDDIDFDRIAAVAPLRHERWSRTG